jgi:hypothetical protein
MGDVSNNFIDNGLDDMTLHLMSNKKALSSYLRKNDTKKYEKIKYEEEIKNIHRKEIIKITYDLLDNNTNLYGSDIINSFNDYIKNIVKKVELSKITDSKDDEEDNNIFVNMDDNKKIIPNVFGFEFKRR